MELKFIKRHVIKQLFLKEDTSKIEREVDEGDNFITIKEKKIIVLDNGSVKEDGEWKIVDKKPKIKPKK